MPSPILSENKEVTEVGDDNKSVCTPIFADLLGVGRKPSVLFDALHFNHAAFGGLSFARLAPLNLISDVKAEIGLPCARIAKVGKTENPGLDMLADEVKELRNGRIVRSLRRSGSQAAFVSKIGEVGFDYVFKLVRQVGGVPKDSKATSKLLVKLQIVVKSL